RDVEPILPAKREEEIVACDTRNVLRLEAEKPSDAVVLVDDMVADSEIGKRLQGPPEPRVRTRGALSEDLRVGEQRETEVTPNESSARRADDEGHRGLGGYDVEVLRDLRLDLPQQSLSSERFTLMSECHDDSSALADHRRELVLRLGKTSRGDRG